MNSRELRFVLHGRQRIGRAADLPRSVGRERLVEANAIAEDLLQGIGDPKRRAGCARLAAVVMLTRAPRRRDLRLFSRDARPAVTQHR